MARKGRLHATTWGRDACRWVDRCCQPRMQKLLAAHRAGLTDVIVPRRNEPDLDDVPESVRAEIHMHPVSTVAEVLWLALPLDVASSERLL